MTIRMAENGIRAISKLLDSMKGVAGLAVNTDSQTEREAYRATYNSLRSQINFIATDSGYSGTNLLVKDNLTLIFGELPGSSSQVIEGFDSSADGLGVGNRIISGTGGTAANQTISVAINSPIQANIPFTRTFSVGGVSQTTISDTLQVSFTNSAPPTLNENVAFSVASVVQDGYLSITGTVGQSVPVSLPKNVPVANPHPPPATINSVIQVPTYASISWGGNQERTFATWTSPNNVLEVRLDGVKQENNFTIDTNGNIVFDPAATPATGQVVSFIQADVWDSTGAAKASIKQLDGAQNILRTKSQALSNTLNVAVTRLEFNDQMGAILAAGADNLTLADMNQESASMLMLQTRQSLGISALTLSSRSQQQLLRIF
jgi:flagellin-like hook-associated protein FlgL